ncbi:MAG TPA: ABC transporter ATP-binding protein [Chthoniobacterales bacterium]|jgi:ABC-type Fe3+/spermidine/putrescine transport system ATPase subunit
MLETIGLRKSYGSQLAVDDFSHRFAPGKITTILGPSGSGKSTVLGMIAGLLQPDRGRVELGGRDLTSISPERRDFGMVFQHYALFPHLNVQQNVEFGLRVRRLTRKRRAERARETLQMIRIEHLADRRIREISGGEQQRVALARAIAIRPKVLLMDEPLSALDARLREELRSELLRLLRDLAITTIYVTHDQIEAMTLGHEMIILNHGQVEQAGPPDELYLRPASLFVANFLGDSNVFAAESEEVSERLRLPFATINLQPNGHNSSPNEHSSRCWAMIRPESMELVPEGEADFAATVESATFLGNRLRLQLRAAGEKVIVDVENRCAVSPSAPVYVKVKGAEVATWPR